MQVKKQQLEPDMEQQIGSKLGKEYVKDAYCHPAYLTYMESTSCKMSGWMKHKMESRFPGEISITQIFRWHHPYGRKWRRTKKPLDESKRGCKKVGLKLNIQKTKIMASGPIISWQIDGETVETVADFILGGSKITADGDCSQEIKKKNFPWKKSYDQPRQHIKKQRHYFANKCPSSQRFSFSSSHVWMCELDYKENWVPKNWFFWMMVLQRTLESPLDCKEIQPVHPKGNQSWIFIGRTDAEGEAPILWPPDAKNWLIRKEPDAGKDWRQEQKGRTEDEIVGWHPQLNGHLFE